ncbi:MAG: beta-ketoacyl synthase chain length factor [Arcobacteraceae bacterium]
MKINLEILSASYLFGEKEVANLNTKELVPAMILRRRLTRASKLIIELMANVDFKEGRIIYGTSFGELLATSNILNAILENDILSPTDFQNSVYNTAVSYASILFKNTSEILTISSGEETSLKVLKVGAIKALDEDEILLVCCETLNINNIEEVNHCIDFLESAVALKVKISKEKATINFENIQNNSYPKAIEHILHIAKNFKNDTKNIIEVEI